MDADDPNDSNVDFSSLFAPRDETCRGHAKQKLRPAKKPTPKLTQASDPVKQPEKPKIAKRPAASSCKDIKRPVVNSCEDERDGRAVNQLSGDAVRRQPKIQRVDRGFWPFEVDYNDHFETSLRAIQDVQPVLQQLCKQLQKPLSELVVYDPFFCKGGIRKHYEALGIMNFIHRNHDFYQDVASGSLPQYDILVTNPPYSEDHKERILEFCLRSGKPWALLLPNYVATKAYYGELLDETATPPAQRPFFLTPRVRYSYDHPEGTGHAESPFFSIWYVGLGKHTEVVHGVCKARFESRAGAAGKAAGGTGAWSGKHAGGAAAAARDSPWDVSIARSVDALRQAGAVPTARRLNPKQRLRLKQQKEG